MWCFVVVLTLLLYLLLSKFILCYSLFFFQELNVAWIWYLSNNNWFRLGRLCGLQGSFTEEYWSYQSFTALGYCNTMKSMTCCCLVCFLHFHCWAFIKFAINYKYIILLKVGWIYYYFSSIIFCRIPKIVQLLMIFSIIVC